MSKDTEGRDVSIGLKYDGKNFLDEERSEIPENRMLLAGVDPIDNFIFTSGDVVDQF